MGQPVTLITTSSPRPGILRFELNRSLTGMGHVRYDMGDEIRSDDPASELAKRLFDVGGVSAVHVYGSMVTVCLLYTSPSPRDQRGSRMPSSA